MLGLKCQAAGIKNPHLKTLDPIMPLLEEAPGLGGVGLSRVGLGWVWNVRGLSDKNVSFSISMGSQRASLRNAELFLVLQGSGYVITLSLTGKDFGPIEMKRDCLSLQTERISPWIFFCVTKGLLNLLKIDIRHMTGQPDLLQSINSFKTRMHSLGSER